MLLPNLSRASLILTGFAFMFGACSDKMNIEDSALTNQSSSNEVIVDSAEYLANLIAYKQSDHKRAVGYFKHLTVGNGGDLTLIPDSVDIVDTFGGMPGDSADAARFRAGIAHLHERGTKVVHTIFLRSGGGPTETDLLDPTIFNNYINQYVNLVNRWGFDGIDIDLETGIIYSAPTMTRIINALSTHFGPASGTGRLFVFDTNMIATSLAANAGVSAATLLRCADYLYIQDYFGSIASSNSKIDGYVAGGYPISQIMLISADFEANYNSTSSSLGPNRLRSYYTNTAFSNKVGGFGAYVFGMDAPNYPHYRAMINYFNPVGI